MRPVIDYHHAPFLVLWEVTRACALACRHCRADAQHRAFALTGDALAADPTCVYQPAAATGPSP